MIFHGPEVAPWLLSTTGIVLLWPTAIFTPVVTQGPASVIASVSVAWLVEVLKTEE